MNIVFRCFIVLAFDIDVDQMEFSDAKLASYQFIKQNFDIGKACFHPTIADDASHLLLFSSVSVPLPAHSNRHQLVSSVCIYIEQYSIVYMYH